MPGPLEGSYHGLKSAGGSIPRLGVTAARLTSDIVTWPEGGRRETAGQGAPGHGQQVRGPGVPLQHRHQRAPGHLPRRPGPGHPRGRYQRPVGKVHGAPGIVGPGALRLRVAGAVGTAGHVFGHADPESPGLQPHRGAPLALRRRNEHAGECRSAGRRRPRGRGPGRRYRAPGHQCPGAVLPGRLDSRGDAHRYRPLQRNDRGRAASLRPRVWCRAGKQPGW